MKNRLNRFIAIICVIGIFITSGVAFAAIPEDANATSQGTIKTANNKAAFYEDVSGFAVVKLNAIGRGLVDSDWQIIMSKGLLTNINMVLILKHGSMFQSKDNYKIWRKANWTKEERGTVQTSWSTGTRLKCDLSGVIEVNGLYDYPINTYDTGITTVK